MNAGHEYYDDPYESEMISANEQRVSAQAQNALVEWLGSRCFPSWGWIFAWLVLGGFPLCLIVLGSIAPASTWSEEYRIDLAEACEKGELDRASVLHGKLVDMGEILPELTYHYALLLENEDRFEDAQVWMERLAPDSGSGFYGAHLWLAGKLVDHNPLLTKEQTEEFAARLRYVLQEQPDNLDAHAMYGVVLEQAGNIDEAETHLRMAAVVRRDASIPLARVRARLGKLDSALREANFAVQHYSDAVNNDPQDIDARVQLAKALLFLEKWPEAEVVLAKGHHHKNDPRIETQLVHTYISAADVYSRTAGKRDQVVPLLLRAFNIDPENQRVLARLLDATDSNSQIPDDVADMMIEQVRNAMETSADDVHLHSKLGQLYALKKDHDRAVQQFEACADLQPIMNLDLAHALRAAGRTEDASAAALKAEREFDRLERLGVLSDKMRFLWANALAMQGKFDEGLQTLMAGLEQNPESQFLRNAISQQLFEQYFKQQQGREVGTQMSNEEFDLLLDAVRYSPSNSRAVAVLAGKMEGDGEEQERAEKVFRGLLAEGRATSVVHMLLGTRAAQRNELRIARFHLEQALPIHGDRPELLNNLAWVYAQQEQADHAKALELIDRAIRIYPGAPELLETRGNVLMKLERWDEAIVELEKALSKLPKRTRLHKLLSEAYREIGDQRTADVHERMKSKNLAPLN